MSIHKSLKRKDTLVRRRNVLTRAERIERLKSDERWQEGQTSIFGLPKVKTQVISAPAARPKPKEKAEAGAPAEPAAGAAPEAAVKPAKGKGREKK